MLRLLMVRWVAGVCCVQQILAAMVLQTKSAAYPARWLLRPCVRLALVVVRAARGGWLLVVNAFLMCCLVVLMAALAGVVRFNRPTVLRGHLCFTTRWLQV